MDTYEKKYNRALEVVRELQKDWASTQNRAAREIELAFPELRESEDEEIRKDIIGGLMWQRDNLKSEGPHDNNLILPGFCLTVGEHLKYLEKQKEPKHAPDDLQKSFEAGQTSIVDNPEQYGLCKKPAWSEEDDVMFKTAKKIIWESEASDGTTNKVISWLEGRFKSLRLNLKK